MTADLSPEEIEARFQAQMFNDSKRIAYCAIGQEDVIRAIVAGRGWDQLIEVRTSSIIVDPTQVFIVDENAIDAATSQRLMHMPNFDEFWNP